MRKSQPSRPKPPHSPTVPHELAGVTPDVHFAALTQPDQDKASADKGTTGLPTDNISLPAIVPLAQVERRAIEHALACCNGNIAEAAAHLGIAPSTIYRKKSQWKQALPQPPTHPGGRNSPPPVFFP